MEPPRDCDLCPRLAAFRAEQRLAHPEWFNAPVPVLGTGPAWLAIIGLAPGLKGANRTGVPFTGDDSGKLLFAVLTGHGIARSAGEGHILDGAVIMNAVRCVPPANRPSTAEVRACRPHLTSALDRIEGLRVIVALGKIAHDAAIEALGHRPREFRFAHGAEHSPGRVILLDSYHCSRHNQNTGRITHNMLWSVFERARHLA